MRASAVFLLFALSVAASAIPLDVCTRNLTSLPLAEHAAEVRDRVRAGTALPREVSVVTPVYRELDNGNLARILRSFTEQSAHPSAFELVFVVNQKPEIAADPANPANVENRRTLALLRWLASPTAPEPPEVAQLPPDGAAAFRAAKARKLRVAVVDLATAGAPTHLGELRQAGVDQALKNRPKDDKRLVAWMDGDTVVSPTYVENLVVTFETQPVEVAFLPYRIAMDPAGPPDQYRSTFADRHKLYVTRYFATMSSAAGGRVIAESPQIVTTAKVLRQRGRVSRQSFNEDWDFSEAVAATAPYTWIHDEPVTTLDRRRPESFNGSTGTKDPRNPLIADPLRYGRLPLARTALERTLDRLERETAKRPATLAEIQDNVLFFGLEWSEARWKQAEAKLRTTNQWAPASDVLYEYLKELPRNRAYPEQFLTMITHRVGPAERERLEKRFATGVERRRKEVEASTAELRRDVARLYRGEKPLNPEQEFLRGNKWIEREFVRARQQNVSVEKLLKAFEKEFPDWFLPFGETPMRQYNEGLLEMTRVFEEIRNDPAAWPETSRYLQEYQRRAGLIANG